MAKSHAMYMRKWRKQNRTIARTISRKANRKYRATHKAERKQYLLSYRKTAAYKISEQKRHESKRRKDYMKKYNRTYRQNPLVRMKWSARSKVYLAIKNGKLKRQNCFCGIIGEAHHKDYAKPLEVVWLCKAHHTELHTKRE